MSDHGPALSVILAGNDLKETRHVRSAIRAQSIAGSLELVLVLPQDPGEEELNLFEGLWGGQVVEAEILSRGAANAHGVRAARAPIVVLSEDHCYPGRRWAEALLADHRGPWAVVGPQVRNANPGTLVSWADFVVGYGPWSRLENAGEADLLPGHNSSYKLEVLQPYDQELEQVLEAETVLLWRLAAAGHRLFLSKSAIVHHLNFSLPSAFLRAQYLNGRQFAAGRASSWNLGRRALYIVGSPLIPAVRAWRLRTCFGASDSGGAPWTALPVLFIGLCIDAFGQAMGYMFGSGGLAQTTASYEFCRGRFVQPGEGPPVDQGDGFVR